MSTDVPGPLALLSLMSLHLMPVCILFIVVNGPLFPSAMIASIFIPVHSVYSMITVLARRIPCIFENTRVHGNVLPNFVRLAFQLSAILSAN